MSRIALIFGISGQDGAYLSDLLLRKGYTVYRTSWDAERTSLANLTTLGIYDKIRIFSASLTDFRSVLHALKQAVPDEIYNLAGQSSVGLSFDQPAETFESIAIATLNLLEGIRFFNPFIRLSTTRVPANASGTRVVIRPRKTRPFVRGVPMLRPRPRPCGK